MPESDKWRSCGHDQSCDKGYTVCGFESGNTPEALDDSFSGALAESSSGLPRKQGKSASLVLTGPLERS